MGHAAYSRDGKPHPASSHDAWEPGWAKRHVDFGEVQALAESWTWFDGLSKQRISEAIDLGAFALSDGEFRVLKQYVAHLNNAQLREGNAYVWPSARLIASRLQCSESKVRALRRSLEVKGFLIRDYHRQLNTPLNEGAIDLGPTIARLAEFEGHVANVAMEIRADRDAARASVIHLQDIGAPAPETWRLKQSPINSSSSVTGSADAPLARNTFTERRPSANAELEVGKDSGSCRASGKPSADGLPRKPRSSPTAFPAPFVATETLRKELELAIQVLPALKTLIPPAVLENPASAPESTLAQLQLLAAELLDDPSRNNDQTVDWAWKRHRIRAAIFLAIAVTDRNVREACRYFGYLTCRPREEIRDLRSNLLRIIEAGPAAPSPAPSVYASSTTAKPMASAPGHDCDDIAGLMAAVRRILAEDLGKKSGEYASWFEGLGFDGYGDDGELRLLTPNGVRRDRIAKDYAQVLPAAAAEAGLDVDVIELRSVTGGPTVRLRRHT